MVTAYPQPTAAMVAATTVSTTGSVPGNSSVWRRRKFAMGKTLSAPIIREILNMFVNLMIGEDKVV